MGLALKLFSILLVAPTIFIGIFLNYTISTLVAEKVEATQNQQLELLNIAHLVLSKATPEDFTTRAREITLQDGFAGFLITDGAGKIKFAAKSGLIGKSAGPYLGEDFQEKISSQETPEGSLKTLTNSGQEILLSFAGLKFGDEKLVLVLTRSMSEASRATILIYLKSGAAWAAFALFSFIAYFWILSAVRKQAAKDKVA